MTSPAERAIEAPTGPRITIAQRLLSVLLVGFVATLAVWNLEDSPVRDAVADDFGHHVNLLHVNQSWALFSPNPSTLSIAVYAIVEFSDGREVRYDFPHGEPVLGAFREYRWRKFERRLRLERYSSMWGPAAQWVADEHRGDGEVVRVGLWRRFSDTPEPGTGEEREWNSTEFHHVDFVLGGETYE